MMVNFISSPEVRRSVWSYKTHSLEQGINSNRLKSILTNRLTQYSLFAEVDGGWMVEHGGLSMRWRNPRTHLNK